MLSTLASKPIYPEFDTQHSNFFSEEKIADVAEFNQWRCLEESGQRLENVDQTI